jgi:hypothetical protein
LKAQLLHVNKAKRKPKELDKFEAVEVKVEVPGKLEPVGYVTSAKLYCNGFIF